MTSPPDFSPTVARPPFAEALFDGTVSLHSGSLLPASDAWEQEQLVPGLKLVIVDRGELVCDLPGSGRRTISGPCICAVWNPRDNESRQRFIAGRPVDYTAISLTPSALAGRIDSGFQQQLHQLFGVDDDRHPRLLIMEASQPIQALHARIATCPLQGISRALFLSGKAMEIMAHALDGLPGQPQSEVQLLRLSSSDLERLHQARSLLASRMINPPSLAELGLSVGINTRKLTSDFRRLFGESVNEYLQNLRLDTAWQLLSQGEVSVSRAAWRVGYTPAHFSVAFRKKFGVSPKSLRG